MLTHYSFTCTKCQKHFDITGHWYNQMLMEWWLDYKWLWHCILYHKGKWNRKDFDYFLKCHICFIPLLVLQILDIMAMPFRFL